MALCRGSAANRSLMAQCNPPSQCFAEARMSKTPAAVHRRASKLLRRAKRMLKRSSKKQHMHNLFARSQENGDWLAHWGLAFGSMGRFLEPRKTIKRMPTCTSVFCSGCVQFYVSFLSFSRQNYHDVFSAKQSRTSSPGDSQVSQSVGQVEATLCVSGCVFQIS